MTILFSGLHYVTDIWVCGSTIGGGMNLGFLVCMGVKYVCTMFL